MAVVILNWNGAALMERFLPLVVRYSPEEIAEVVNKIPQEDKPKVLYLYGHSEDEIRVSGKDFYGGFWIESSG